MKPEPLVSVIIPTYNRSHILGTALHSVLQQTYQHWECLVVDDGSQDATVLLMQDFIKKDQRIQYYQRNRAPKGAPTCRNIGLEHAKGDYIIFLDSDDYLLPHCLKQRVEAFNSHPGCDFMVFPMAEKKGDAIKAKAIPKTNDYLKLFLSAQLPWQTMCPIWKQSYLKKLNGFTEGYPRFNDPELMIRALLPKNVKYKVLDELPYDSVYIIINKDIQNHISIVYESLKLFVPDVVNWLEMAGKNKLKYNLRFYLHFWIKYLFVQSSSLNFIQAFSLINMFKYNGIISFKFQVELTIRLLTYVVSSLMLKKPLDKLSQNSLYQYPK